MYAARKEIGGWSLVRQLGSGGMGQAWKVMRETTPGQQVLGVMKLPLATNVADEATMARWVTELRALMLLQGCGNVVRIIDAGVDGRIFYIVMEYVHGTDLSHLAKIVRRSGKRFHAQTVAWIGGEILHGLVAIHGRMIGGKAQHLCHLDIALKNVLASSDGEIKIADFGIAKLGDEKSLSIRGTPRYIAPEQHRGDPVQASDVFAWAVCMWELLEGQPYRKAVEQQQLYNEIQYGALRRLERADIPTDLAALIHDCLVADPKQRPMAKLALRRLEGMDCYRVERSPMRDLIAAHVTTAKGSGHTELIDWKGVVPTPELAGLLASVEVHEHQASAVRIEEVLARPLVQLHPDELSGDEPAWPSIGGPSRPSAEPPLLERQDASDPRAPATLQLGSGSGPGQPEAPRAKTVSIDAPRPRPRPETELVAVPEPMPVLEPEPATLDTPPATLRDIEPPTGPRGSSRRRVARIVGMLVSAVASMALGSLVALHLLGGSSEPTTDARPSLAVARMEAVHVEPASKTSSAPAGAPLEPDVDEPPSEPVLEPIAAPQLTVPTPAPVVATDIPAAATEPATSVAAAPTEPAPTKRASAPKTTVEVRVDWIPEGIDVKIGRTRRTVRSRESFRVESGRQRLKWRPVGSASWTDSGTFALTPGMLHVLQIGKNRGKGGVIHDPRRPG